MLWLSRGVATGSPSPSLVYKEGPGIPGIHEAIGEKKVTSAIGLPVMEVQDPTRFP